MNRLFWFLALLSLGIVAFCSCIVLIFPLLMTLNGKTFPIDFSNQIGVIQTITSCVSLFFTIFAVWFIVKEFTKGQREADVRLMFANDQSWIGTGASVKSPITLPLEILNRGSEPAKHISLMVEVEKTLLGNEQTVSSEINSKIQGTSVEQLNDKCVLVSITSPTPPSLRTEIQELYASVFHVSLGKDNICYPHGDTIRFGELILKWDDSKIIERRNLSVIIRYKINAEPMRTRQGHLEVRLVMTDSFRPEDI